MAVRRILTTVATVAIGTHAPSEALASPRSDPTLGRAVFTGSTLGHPTSLTLNPAALSVRPGKRSLYFAFLGTLQQTSIDTQQLDLDTGTLSPGERVSDLQLAPGGQAMWIERPSERIAFGFELRVPPREMHLEDHEALRYSTLGGGQQNYVATVGVSARLVSRLHIGASLSHDFTDLQLRYARDTALETGNDDCGGAPCGLGNPQATELYDVDVRSKWVSAKNLRLNLGFAVQLATDLWIGLAYHTPPGLEVQTTLDGDVTVTQAPRDGGAELTGGSTVYISYPASIDGELRARIWRGLDLHVGGRWEDLSRFSAYDVRTFGSTFRANGIPEWMPRARGMHDAYSIWAGVEQHDTGDQLLLGARLGYETASVDARKTSALTIAPAAFTVDLGVQGRVVPGAPWWLQLSYGLALSPTVDARANAFDPRHRLDCVDSGFDYTSSGCELTRGGYAVATGAGDYTRIQHALRVGLQYEWQ